MLFIHNTVSLCNSCYRHWKDLWPGTTSTISFDWSFFEPSRVSPAKEIASPRSSGDKSTVEPSPEM